MAPILRNGESGVVNRQGFIDGINNDIYQLNSDITFYASELADREIVVREYLHMHQFRRAFVMWLDKRMWAFRIKQAAKAKKKLAKIKHYASSWL